MGVITEKDNERGGFGCTQADNPGAAQRPAGGGQAPDAGTTGGADRLSKSALGKYETDDYKDISPFAIATLADFYGVSTDYLMGLTENKNHPNTELQSLHLSDDMVELLSSGKINNRLLCDWLPTQISGG